MPDEQTGRKQKMPAEPDPLAGNRPPAGPEAADGLQGGYD